MRKMPSFRRSLIVGIASVLLLLVVIGEASSQTAGKRDSETPTEMAEAIAHAVDTKAARISAKIPGGPLALLSATSHDNVVELHYKANETRLFPHTDAEREERRLRFAYRFCLDGRVTKHGVVIHQVLTTPDNGAPFEFIIDGSTCDALVADIKARTAGMKRPESLDEPKHILTIPIRPGQVEQQ